jgi:vacuolar protein sorting-associated protein VTA1
MDELPALPGTVKFVQPLMARATELARIDPVISYYCKLHSVQQILATNYHTTEPDVAEYVGALLDNIENAKADNVMSESLRAVIADDDAAQAYIESFATKIFAKADREVRNKTTTRATSSTFMAAATFLDLLRIFQSPLEKDIADKMKYAKFHAARILKAFKANENPNDYDPPMDQHDDILADIELASSEPAPSEQAPFEPMAFETAPTGATTVGEEPSEETTGTIEWPAAPPNLPSAPPILPSTPADLPNTTPSSTFLPSGHRFPPPPRGNPNPPPVQPVYQSSPPPTPAVSAAGRSLSNSYPTTHEHRGPSLSKADIQSIMDQTELVASAQKHAKFAISALNYDDITTAVKELKAALELLEQHQN